MSDEPTPDPPGDDGERPAEVRYQDGLVRLPSHVRERPHPYMTYDPRADAYVAPGSRLAELRPILAQLGITVPEPIRLAGFFHETREPRPYQREALDRWSAAAGRGTVVLPTGAGKTLVALHAIQELGCGACVVAPTRALVDQWYSQASDAFGEESVGAFYSAEKEVRPITITTYHSAFALLERWGARFGLLVLDEAHRLEDTAAGEAKTWHDALRIAPAPFRLGLTATYPDGRDAELRRLVGGVAYRKAVGEMTEAELADFALERRLVPLAPEEQSRYDRLTEEYESYFSARGWTGRKTKEVWPAFMGATRRDLAARRAFRAYLERERVVALSTPKLREAERILRLFPTETALLFCGSAEAAERVSRRLAIPLIAAETPASERKAIRSAVEAGEIRAVASVKVLDEGWDLPAAKLGIVLGDTSRGGRRQMQQRLGRILRRQGDATASLFELVSPGTYEFLSSQKRGKGLRGPGDPQLGLGF